MNLPDAIDAVRPTVVQVSLHAVDPSSEFRERFGRSFIHQTLGTGFFVSEDYVITAKHVIDGGRQGLEQLDAERKGMSVGVAQPNIDDPSGVSMRANFSTTSFSVAAEDELNDLSLLKLEVSPFRGEMSSGIVIRDEPVPLLFAVAELDSARPRDGEHVGVSGYPLANPVLITNSGAIASSWASVTHEVPVPLPPELQTPPGFVIPEFTMPEPADRYLADVEVNAGNSGGPVFRVVDAQVVGVCVATQNATVQFACTGEPVELDGRSLVYSSGLTVVIPMSQVERLLDEVG